MRSLFFATLALASSALSFAEQTYPRLAEKAGDFELGSAILLLMPKASAERIEWDNQADGPIQWLTEGFNTEQLGGGDTITTRQGLLRINVMGSYSHVLKQRKYALAWTVRYLTKSNPKFGVESIDLTPGSPNDQCFGTLFDGCEFDLLPSLKKAGFQIMKICESGVPSGQVIAYQVKHPGKKAMNVIWKSSGGSGGTSSWIEMNIDPPTKALCPQ